MTVLEFNSSPPASLADKAYLAIRDKLIMLEISPGEPIDDDLLAASLGMGRTPIREALKRLEGDRLVAGSRLRIDPRRRLPRGRAGDSLNP